jgi:hypothetical protein
MEANNDPLDQEHFQPAPTAEYDGLVQEDINARLRSVASWFYWIAGLSLLNAIIVGTGANWAFYFGLAITQVIDVVGLKFKEVQDISGGGGISGGQIACWFADLLVLGFFVFLAIMFTRRMAWALWIAVILYGLDTLFFLVGMHWVALGFHVFVIYKLSRGFSILKEAREIAVA